MTGGSECMITVYTVHTLHVEETINVDGESRGVYVTRLYSIGIECNYHHSFPIK